MLKEALCTAPFQLTWRSYEEPPLALGQVRVRADFAAAKHGTELALYSGVANDRGRFDERWRSFFVGEPDPYCSFPMPVGNMIVGKVVELGPGVQTLKRDQRVLCHGSFKPTHTVAESKCWPMPDGMPWQSAVCLDPADFALAALRDGSVRVGDAIAVFGLGAIALLVVQLARLAGAHPIIAVDPLASRRELAQHFGATHLLNPREEDAGMRIKQICEGRGADVAIEYSGSPQALQAALRGVAFGGTVVCGAFPPPYAAGLDLGAEAHMNVPNLIFSRAESEPFRDHPRWNNARVMKTCFSLLAEGRLTGEGIVSEPVPFDSVLDAFEAAVKEPGKIVKLGVKF